MLDEIIIPLITKLIEAFFIFIFLWTVFSYMFSPKKSIGLMHSAWQQTFDNLQLSTQEIYTDIEEAIKKRDVPGVQIARVTYHNYNSLSASREYLQISRDEHILLVCAAPFGKDYFVSWRMGESISFLKDLVPRIPVFGKLLQHAIFGKTFYQLDTEAMVKGIIQNSVLEVIDGITQAKGLRGLSELERKPTDISYLKAV